MGKMRQLALVLLAGITLGTAVCASPSEIDAPQFVGRWMGETTEDNDDWKIRYVIDRKSNGSFSFEANEIKGGKTVSHQFGGGKWFVQAGLYTIRVESTSDNEPKDEIYNVVTLEQEAILLETKLLGIRLVERRVGPNYQLP
jgi:hypothetical protein